MIQPTARVTGTVVETTTQRGHKNGRDWEIRTTRVLVNGRDLCEVQLQDEQGEPIEGSAVDWRVHLGASGNYLSVRYAGQWPAPLAAPPSASQVEDLL